MSAVISRVFMNGNHQAVRIPQEFRTDVNLVSITRNAQGDLVIRPLPVDRATAFLQALQGFDGVLGKEFVARLTESQAQRTPPPDRDAL
jgi:antitoxin VapB